MLATARWSLEEALLSWMERRRRNDARRFLGGLSIDELQFLANFAGASVLEGCHLSENADRRSWVRQFTAHEPDDQKIILLYEFLTRWGWLQR